MKEIIEALVVERAFVSGSIRRGQRNEASNSPATPNSPAKPNSPGLEDTDSGARENLEAQIAEQGKKTVESIVAALQARP